MCKTGAAQDHITIMLRQVDGVLMSHPQVAEAVAFACPDEKYGEIVAAAVVPNKPVSDTAAFAKDLQKLAGQKMAAFKVRAPHACHLMLIWLLKCSVYPTVLVSSLRLLG